MPRDFRAYLDDILQAIDRIRQYTSGMTFETFCKEPLVQDAVIRNLEIIGEAVRHIPKRLREQSTSIVWPRVVGLRDVLIHRYFGVDLEIVWDVVVNKLAELEPEIRRLVSLL
jgi:uncharacterized protein with HEPN domain